MRIFLTFLLSFTFMGLYAQPETDPFGSEYNFDSTAYSDSGTSESAMTTTMVSQDNQLIPTTYKRYERFKAPIDTITELVTYMGVVPFTPLANDVYDGGTIDSLYWRAKFFLMQKYIKDYRAGKKPYETVFPKDMLIEDMKPDGENGRIVIRPTIPLMVKNNTHSYTQLGTLTFKLEIRVKEDKYKYKFTNFVHNTPEKGSEKIIKTYVEFYANANRGVKGTDRVLLSIDRMVKEFIKELAKIMKDPVVLDPDDF